jgi:hypothetical protein
MSLRDIAKEIGCSHSGIELMLRGQARAAKSDDWLPRPASLQAGEREVIIMLALHDDLSMTAIALQLGRSPSTVTRDVKANGGRENYWVWPAHQRAQENSKRPKPSKLANRVLWDQVIEWLQKFWSPEEISACLRLQVADDPTMHVSHETIYQLLVVQGRGELRRELARCLRSHQWLTNRDGLWRSYFHKGLQRRVPNRQPRIGSANRGKANRRQEFLLVRARPATTNSKSAGMSRLPNYRRPAWLSWPSWFATHR